MGKLVPSSLFYLPCQAQNAGDSFFIDFNDSNRAPLDPYQWAEFAANHVRPPEPVQTVDVAPAPVEQPVPKTSCQKLRIVREMIHEEQEASSAARTAARRQAAIDQWHSALPGTGNAAFFRLGVDLRGTDMSLSEIEATLWQEAGHARHPAERRDQIKAIMRTLAQQPSRAVA